MIAPFAELVPCMCSFAVGETPIPTKLEKLAFPVTDKLVFVVNAPSTVIVLPDSETIESAITCVDDHLGEFPGVRVQ